jgi:hypothetical protein
MAKVEIEKFNNLTAVAQGREVRDLVSAERDWLETVGLGTIIFNQRVIHPVEGVFEGDDIDYWVKPGEDRSVHTSVASLLIGQGLGKYSIDRRGKSFETAENLTLYQAIASTIQDHPNPPLGFASTMRTVGDPTVLSTDMPGDPYGMARDGKIAQLYSLTAVDFN